MSQQHDEFKQKLKVSEAARSSTRSFINKFNQMQATTDEKLKQWARLNLLVQSPLPLRNPFSDTYQTLKFDKNAQDYGRPPPGSKTEKRGIKAAHYVTREVVFLCELIHSNGSGVPPDCTIKFGPLFYSYAHYSGSLVGMLIRARKYGLVHFDGETLYQGQDDRKEIRLLKTIEEIRAIVTLSSDPANCIAIKQ